jgi:hypothetical protein
MYWYSPSKKRSVLLFTGFILLLGIAACKRDGNAAADTMKFFDIKGFFRTDSLRLAKLNPLVNKTVVHNQVAETKKVHIPNWGTELSLFTESDINKPAWRASYVVQTDGNLTVYRAKDPSLKTRVVAVKKEGGKVKWLMIFNYSKNLLYETVEQLSYFPDSLYLIQKSQRIRILGKDTYRISGSLN